MKLSRSNSQSQGENNRETYPSGPRSRSPVPQHSSDSNRSPGRWRRQRLRLRNHFVQALTLNYKAIVLTSGPPILRKPNKNQDRIAACSQPLYSSQSQLCCRRTHSFGTISGSRLTSFCRFLPCSSGDVELPSQFPAFFAFAILSSIGQLALYAADMSAVRHCSDILARGLGRLNARGGIEVCADRRNFCVCSLAVCVFGTAGQDSHPRGRNRSSLCSRFGGCVCPQETSSSASSPGLHLLEQTIYLIECGILVSIFIFSAYFHLSWPRKVFGIALGLSISACVHLATWAVIDNGGLPHSTRVILDFRQHGHLPRLRADLVLLSARSRKGCYEVCGSSARD